MIVSPLDDARAVPSIRTPRPALPRANAAALTSGTRPGAPRDRRRRCPPSARPSTEVCPATTPAIDCPTTVPNDWNSGMPTNWMPLYGTFLSDASFGFADSIAFSTKSPKGAACLYSGRA